MLLELVVRNHKLIRYAQVSFEEGFHVVTGQSGAGKSMFLSALRLISGDHLKGVKNTSEDVTLVEAVFDISENFKVSDILAGMDVLAEDGLLVLKRKIDEKNRSRIFINGAISTLKDLKNLSTHLIDIHTQNAHSLLRDSSSHLSYLDFYSPEIKEKLESYKLSYDLHQKLLSELKDLEKRSVITKEKRALMEFQMEEFQKVSLDQDNYQYLLSERKKIIQIQKLVDLKNMIRDLLDGEEGVISKMQSLTKVLEEATLLNDGFDKYGEVISDMNASIEDLYGQLSREISEDVSSDEDLEKIEEELYNIESLARKYKVSVEGLLGIKESLLKTMDLVFDKEFLLKEMSEKIESNEKILEEKAATISKSRLEGKSFLEKRMAQELLDLGIANAKFEARVLSSVFAETGKDAVSFWIQTNKGYPLLPLEKVASGGEFSRIVLAFKKVFASQGRVPTFVFDEVDANLGGEEAALVGKKLKSLAQDHQLICITHCPQIAMLADEHICVLKKDEGSSTLTEVKKLSEKESDLEVKRMLGGAAFFKLQCEEALLS
ncbi:hypothetical protein AB834_05090 [PVC group bacterium (ex Bugula neritina AB1)]|nr:hypothetical protein AB834_05090 [PVC group bacterium (ex Bugula neritina AB1)]